MRSSSPFIARAVSATTGMARVFASPLSNAVASRPSMPGSWMSINTRSGCSSRAIASPSSALVALITTCPSDSSRNVERRMFAALSSTTRIVAILCHHAASGHGSPHFGNEAIHVHPGFPDDRRDLSVEAMPVRVADLHRRHDDDRYPGGGGPFMQRRHDIEAGHVR